jgi:C-terminal processing protease CtpA/Prc
MARIVFLLTVVEVRAALAQSSCDTTVGVTVSTSDFSSVIGIVPGAPAAKASLHIGDRIVSYGDIAASQIHTPAELEKATCGPAGSEIDLQVRRVKSEKIIHVRLQRVHKDDKMVPDVDPNQASRHPRPNHALEPTTGRADV